MKRIHNRGAQRERETWSRPLASSREWCCAFVDRDGSYKKPTIEKQTDRRCLVPHPAPQLPAHKWAGAFTTP